MTLRFFTSFALLALTVAQADAAQDRSVPYKVWFDHDGTNIISVIAPWQAKPGAFSEEAFRASIAELKGTGVDAVAFSPGNGAIPWWQSKQDNHWEWFTKRTGKKPGVVGRYIMAGGDLVKAFVEECRKADIASIISLRLKDEHSIENLNSEWVPRFYYEHQHWRLDPRQRAVFGLRGLNWMYPEVSAQRVAVLTELAENYDIDGVQLDFMRFPPFFDLEKSTYAQRRDVMTGFIRKVRILMDKTSKPGKKRVLAIRVPNRIKEYDALGIDLRMLDREGLVDIINISPSYVSQVESDVGLFCAWAPKTAVFYELTHTTSRGPSPSWGGGGDDYQTRITTDEQFRTAANLAYARGAAGISLFNFVYSRPATRNGTYALGGSIGREPPFHIIKELRDPKQLRASAQHYWIPYWWKTGYHGRQFQLPRTFVVGTREELTLDMQLPEAAVTGGRLRLRKAGTTPVLSATEPVVLDVLRRPLLKWQAKLNGVLLQSTKNVSEPFEEPYKGFLGDPADYFAWDVPAEVMKNGNNTIQFELVDAPISEEFKVDVIWVDLGVYTK